MTFPPSLLGRGLLAFAHFLSPGRVTHGPRPTGPGTRGVPSRVAAPSMRPLAAVAAAPQKAPTLPTPPRPKVPPLPGPRDDDPDEEMHGTAAATGRLPLVKPPRIRRPRTVHAASAVAAEDLDLRAALSALKRRVFLDERQAAAYLGITVPTFREMRRAGDVPPPVASDSRVRRWRRVDLHAVPANLGASPSAREVDARTS